MTDTLKIAFYSDSFLPAVDGVVTSILNFREELTKRGHEVYVFASGNSKTMGMLKDKRNVFVIRGIKFRKYPQYNLAFLPPIESLKTINIKMDIAHLHTPFLVGTNGLLVAKVNRVPIVGTFHTMFADKAVIEEYLTGGRLMSSLLSRSSWRYARFFYNRCNVVTAPSAAIKRLLERKRIKNTVIVPNSVDTKRFNPSVDGSALRKRLLKKRNEKMVLYAGRISKEKHIEVLIAAAKILRDKDIRFIICGTGPSIAHYQSVVDSLHLNSRVRFMGFISNSMLPRYYAACDAFCIPSTFETQGIAALEAMAVGKPVIGADRLALGELIKNGKNGEKFTPGSGKSCAKKIERVLYNIDSYRGMVSTARVYSIEKTTDQLLNVYKRLIEAKSSNKTINSA